MPKRSAAMYGMMGELPNRGDLNTMVLDMLEQLNEVPAPNEKTKAAE
jgi:hypothetical protein